MAEALLYLRTLVKYCEYVWRSRGMAPRVLHFGDESGVSFTFLYEKCPQEPSVWGVAGPHSWSERNSCGFAVRSSLPLLNIVRLNI
jgi:hypothetical protein